MPENKGYIVNSDEKGSVNICQSVIAVIAASAAIDVDGVHGLYQSHGKELTEVSSKRGLARGVRTNIDEDGVSLDVNLIIEIDYSVGKVSENVQKAVRAALEEAVGVTVKDVNITISGVSRKKSVKAAQ